MHEDSNLPLDCSTDPLGALKKMFVDIVQRNRIECGQAPALRAVFLKPHGVVGGKLKIDEHLPEELRVGIFQQTELDTVIRFSSDTIPTNADERTTVGIAIKLFGVPGKKLLHEEASTCDLILQNHPVFFVDTAKDMCEFTRASVVDRTLPAYLDEHPTTTRILGEMEKFEPSVLRATYWSILPSKFGDGRYVKFKLSPRGVDDAVASAAGANYLYADLKSRLLRRPAEFDLLIQLQKDPVAMPLDQATVPWDETLSPPIRIGTLLLPQQNIDAPRQAAFGENLSFNIWQTLAEHEPQGSLAAARRPVYTAGAELRRTRNQVPQSEPTEPIAILPPIDMPSDKNIVRAAIYPTIGIARVGDSREPGEGGYYVGPEVPDAPTLEVGKYKDKMGALKREAARFRIFGYNAQGEVVGELTPDNAVIEWTAHLANKKAAWYEFHLALDVPEASSPTAPPSKRRNALVKGDDRKKLVIDPGPRTIHGRNKAGSSYEFRGGMFFDREVPLGELRTDSDGRLLVLGGFGLSRSIVDQPPQDFANNEGWHDDVADGPVDARVTIDGRSIPVEGSWVLVGPPNYAPALKSVRTLYDLLFDRMVAWGLMKEPETVSFERHIQPIFERLSGLQWVNLGFASWFGSGAPFDLAALLPRLADASEANKEFRQRVLEQFRNPAKNGQNLGKSLWPQVYGDALDSLTNNSPADSSVEFPAGLAFLSGLQLKWLRNWAEGKFINEPNLVSPKTPEDVPLEERPHLLTEAALNYCLADAFHPGCEVTWPVRMRWLYSAPFRIRRRPENFVEPDYGDVLTPEEAVSPMGPSNGAAAGDLTRWMAVPWQTDTASCLSGYPFFRTSPSLPTFWPARVPNDVLSEADFKTVMDSSKSDEERRAAFLRRQDWFRAFVGPDDIVQMVDNFAKLGTVEAHKGPDKLHGVPSKIWVETRLDLPEPGSRVAGLTPELTDAQAEGTRRQTLRKFGKRKVIGAGGS